MTIYSVNVWNGETYDDSCEESFGVFESQEKALAYGRYILDHKQDIVERLWENEKNANYNADASWAITIQAWELNKARV